MTVHHNQFTLFMKRRFMPLFITQYSGAFNDNFLKCAILTMVTFLVTKDSARAGVLTNLAMALFILPFFLFSAAAGTWVDSVDKARCCRIVKVIEIVLMLLAAIALHCQWIAGLLILLFCMGTQSTFFGPAKFALLPQHLEGKELLAGNAFVDAGTFIAILTGSIAGSLLAAMPGGMLYSGGVLVVLAVIGCIAAWQIPPAPPAETGLTVSWNIIGNTYRLLREGLQERDIRDCILTLSIFWMAGALYISILPLVCLTVIGGNELVSTIFLTIFSVGVAVGALGANAVLKGMVSGRLAPLAMFFMALFTLDLAWCCRMETEFTTLAGPLILCHDVQFWRICGDLFAISFFVGMFSVPLKALLQHLAPAGMVARVIAALNVVNSAFMAGGTLIAAAAHKLWALPPGIPLAALALVLLGNAFYSRRLAKSK